MGSKLEKLGQYIIGLLAVVVVYFSGYKSSDFENFKEILSSAVNVSAISAGFLATAMSLLISLTNDSIIERLKKFGLYKKLINFLKSSIAWTFLIALISSAGLFFNRGNTNSDLFFYIWIFVCVVGFVSVVRVVRILSKILDKMSE
ncbi:hypothetical protein [Paenibacillus timonensis]|uniref:hypothetical protein n=1 Tax=Paenibacillus timonensis TaxID=225915 RepID=UPI003F9C0B0A